MPRITPQYLAGIVDSDGSLSISKHNLTGRKPHFRVLFQLTWRLTPECSYVIEYLLTKYGGSVHMQIGSNLSPHNTYLHYSLYDKSILKFLKDVKPFVIVKKKQLDICYSMAVIKKELGHFGAKNPKPFRVIKREECLYKKCILLNSSGKSLKNKSRSKKLAE